VPGPDSDPSIPGLGDAALFDVASAGGGLAAETAVESRRREIGESEAAVAVAARGFWEGVWIRFRRDRVAVVSGVFIIALFVVAIIGEPLAVWLLGHGPNEQFIGGVDPATLLPVGPWTHVPTADGVHTTLFILGGSDSLGRDEFLRLLYGARVSLEVAILATFFGVSIGVILGACAGYFGGWTDTLVSRATDIVMAFPLLLFAIALAETIGQRLNSITLGIFDPGVVTLVLVISAFSWYYPARIIRGLVLSLREKEFIEAAHMVGAGDWRIIRSHLMPHMVAPVIVYSTLIIAQNVLFEAGLSYLGLGIPLPTASWGNLLSQATDYYTNQPWLMVWPGLAMLVTVLSFNLLGDGLRDAFDPRSGR
jgi:peptide/nickel transport system permease protein